MYEEILPEFDRPIYIQKDVIFTNFAVDKVADTLNNYTVFYAATSKYFSTMEGERLLRLALTLEGRRKLE